MSRDRDDFTVRDWLIVGGSVLLSVAITEHYELSRTWRDVAWASALIFSLILAVSKSLRNVPAFWVTFVALVVVHCAVIYLALSRWFPDYESGFGRSTLKLFSVVEFLAFFLVLGHVLKRQNP